MRKLFWSAAGIILTLAIAVAVLTGTRSGQDFVLERLVAAVLVPAPAETFDGLRVFICGSSSPLPAANRAQACIAILAGEDIYLVDAGAGSPLTVNLARLPLQNLRAVLLTHLHSDHIAAIGDFNMLSWVAGRPAPLEIIGPTGVAQVVAGFNEAYELDGGYRTAHHGADLLPPDLHDMHARTIEAGQVLEHNGLEVRAFNVDHRPIAPALGFRFDYKGRSVVISGDTVTTPDLLEAAQGADLLLHDAISIPIIQAFEKGLSAAGAERQTKILHDIQDYHAPVAALGQLAQTAGVKQLALYHLIPPPQNFFMERMFRRDLPAGAILTEDAMVFDLPANSSDVIVR